MLTALAEDVRALAVAEGAVVEFERVAVTEEQVRTYHLPTAPAKASDHRSFSGTTTQAEALGAGCPRRDCARPDPSPP